MTTVHTFHTAQGTKVTRKSQTRAYEACLVATVTEAVMEGLRAEVRKCEAAVPKAEADLAALLAERGTTVEAAKAQYQEESENADGAGKAWFTLKFEEQGAIRKESGGYVPGADRLAEERLVARGLKNPYRPEGPFAVVVAASNVEGARKGLEWARKRLAAATVGDQSVVSWHLTLSNAMKALGTPVAGKHTTKKNRWGGQTRLSDADRLRNEGYKVSIETTFEVRETKPRKKA